MQIGEMINKEMNVEIPSETTENVSCGCGGGGIKFQVTHNSTSSNMPALTRQPSAIKSNCLCSPTSHAASFRCRLHHGPSLQRTRSIDSVSLRDSDGKVNVAADGIASDVSTVEAQ